MTSMLRSLLLAPLTASFLCFAATASAAPGAPAAAPAPASKPGAAKAAKDPKADAKVRAQASALYEEGKAALAARDAERCEAKFFEAYALIPKPIVLLKVAECRKMGGAYPGVVEILERYLAEAPEAPDRAAVEGQIATVKATPGTVSVTSTPPGATIWVDGESTGAVTPGTVQVPPGEHRVELRLADHRTEEQILVVTYGAKKEVDLSLAPEPRSLEGDSVPAAPPPRRGYHPGAAFWIATGTTVAAAGVATAFGLMALDKHSKFAETPTRELYDEGRRDALITDVATGVAVASGIMATVFFFGSRGPSETADRAVSLTPTFSRGGGGLVGHVRF